MFWEGFCDEHGGLLADISEVTARAAELAAQVPALEHAALLDSHIEGLFGLEGALNQAVTSAQAGSAYTDDGGAEIDEEAVAHALALWRHVEVALDLLREHNGLYAAMLAADFAGQLEALSSLASLVVEAAIDRSMEGAAKRTQESLQAFEDTWKTAALSVAKIPADVAVDVAVGAAITAGVPLILGAAGVTGTLPAVLVALAIAGGASYAWNAASEGWGPDVGSLHREVQRVNGYVDIGADATAIEHVGQGFQAGAEQVGKVSLYLTVLLDLAATGVAIDGIFEAASAWEAFKIEHARLQEVWDDATVLFGGFVRFADQMKGALVALSEEIGRREAAIAVLEGEFGGALHDI